MVPPWSWGAPAGSTAADLALPLLQRRLQHETASTSPARHPARHCKGHIEEGAGVARLSGLGWGRAQGDVQRGARAEHERQLLGLVKEADCHQAVFEEHIALGDGDVGGGVGIREGSLVLIKLDAARRHPHVEEQ